MPEHTVDIWINFTGTWPVDDFGNSWAKLCIRDTSENITIPPPCDNGPCIDGECPNGQACTFWPVGPTAFEFCLGPTDFQQLSNLSDSDGNQICPECADYCPGYPPGDPINSCWVELEDILVALSDGGMTTIPSGCYQYKFEPEDYYNSGGCGAGLGWGIYKGSWGSLEYIIDGGCSDEGYKWFDTRQAGTIDCPAPPDPPVGCFVADTMVSTPNGEIAIQDLKAGDLVNSFVNSDDELTTSTISALISHNTNEDGYGLYKLKTKNNEVVATGNHPFVTLLDDVPTWSMLVDFKVGDKIFVESGTAETITSLEKLDYKEDTFNLMIDDTHTYIADGFRVHNAFGDYPIRGGDIVRSRNRMIRTKRHPHQVRRVGGRIKGNRNSRYSGRTQNNPKGRFNK